jgi:hypothetical protein
MTLNKFYRISWQNKYSLYQSMESDTVLSQDSIMIAFRDSMLHSRGHSNAHTPKFSGYPKITTYPSTIPQLSVVKKIYVKRSVRATLSPCRPLAALEKNEAMIII